MCTYNLDIFQNYIQIVIANSVYFPLPFNGDGDKENYKADPLPLIYLQRAYSKACV